MSLIQKVRIPKELEQLKKTIATHGIVCQPESIGDFSNLVAIIPGPKDSPYKNGRFRARILINYNYPFRPPTIRFETTVFHPNIDNSGQICLDILRAPPEGSYNPAITLESILLSIQLLLATPNPDDPLNSDAAELFRNNRAEYDKTAIKFVEKYASIMD